MWEDSLFLFLRPNQKFTTEVKLENIKYILSVAGTVLSLAAACITFAIKMVKAIKEKKETLNREGLIKALPELIEAAESFNNYSGEEKKEYVLTKVNQYAIESKLSFDLSFVSNKIEELITLSKQVNNKTILKQNQGENYYGNQF